MRRKSLVLSLMLLLCLTLTGCGAKKSGIVVGITNDLDSLDPHKAVAAGTNEVLFNIFEGLVKPNSEGELVPAVARDYEVSTDGLKYTFHLRKDVKFHNGKTVTVDDVIYSLKRCAGLLEEKDPNVKQISALSIILKINRVDDETIEIILSEANAEILNYLTCSIIPADYKEQETKPVGTGPFRFVSYEALGSLVIEKNKDYYGEAAKVDQVKFKICADTDSAFMEVLSGGIDIFPYMTDSNAKQLNDDYTVEIGNSNVVQALFLNNAVAPFDDVRVRQALCYAVDRQAIIDMVSGGEGTIIGSSMFPSFKNIYAPELADVYAVNIEKAKELLKEAGYENGFEFTITVPSNYQVHVDTAQIIVEQLKAIGVTAKIQQVEWASWLDDVYQGRKYDATVVGLVSDLAPGKIMSKYRSTAKDNFTNYKNEEYDKLYEKIMKTVDEGERAEYYHQLQSMLTNDAASVFIQDAASLVAVNKRIGGYKFYPVYVQDMSSIYLK